MLFCWIADSKCDVILPVETLGLSKFDASDREGLKSLFFPIKNHIRLWIDMTVAAILGIVVVFGNESINRAARAGYAANSKFFWPLSPGGIVGFFLSGGPHSGSQTIGTVIMWFVDVGLYWSVWKLLSWAFRKLAAPKSPT